MLVELHLPYPVSSNRYWATRVFTPKEGGRPQALTYITADAKAFKLQVAWAAKAAGVRAPIAGRIEIAYALHPKLPQDWRTRARKDPQGWEDTVMCMDLDNAQKVLIDALKGVVFEDDKWVRKITALRGEPRAEAGLVVFVGPLVVEAAQAALELTQ